MHTSGSSAKAIQKASAHLTDEPIKFPTCLLLNHKSPTFFLLTSHLYVYDDMQLGYSDWVDQEPEFSSKCFHVDNPGSICVALLPLDGRVITAKGIIEGGVCDCLLLTEKEMCFMEFKTNATSTETLRILDNAAKASEQLWHTYNVIIRPRCIDALKSSKELELLYVNFHVVFDRDLEVTGANSSLMDLQDQFLKDKKHSLFFDYGKTFE
ncbi:hypothetical protein [Prevotella fusca]|uniref:Uncharacterized protein n=1 Tax=Prevotella fusca JCM 17724 TaxID=1236517 RepID=A0A0K1NN03_9BACT|nr:hypothetical protein [Prevotella fusca]AKU70467.1 hypothetical protein ADJ77_11960 [Prevotella fusca JCM 17724]QUB86096.1 hypothetical protein J5A51_02190 [Prevotella fusca JCM 17724]